MLREQDDQAVTALLVTMAEKHLHDFATFWKTQ
jgi:hypothetical protein